MLYLYFKAPFGSFRAFQSVEMVATADFVTHSAAYGLLLGLAGINRDRKDEFIGARIALGTWRGNLPVRGRCYQQAHKIKQASTSKAKGGETLEEAFERSKGTKPHIQPVWREYLYGLQGYIGLDHQELEEQVRHGINNPAELNYWGIPFLGDNNFFIERLREEPIPNSCEWLCKLDDEKMPRGERLFYLSVWTDYRDNKRSLSRLFYLGKTESEPPSEAWVEIREADDS